MIQIAKSQDAEVGDGTTSVVLLAGEFLKQLKPYVEEGVHPRIIIKAVRRAQQLCQDKINQLAVSLDKSGKTDQRALLEKCAATALNSKLIHQQKEFFSKMVVDAVLQLDELLPLNMIGIKKVSGGALEDSSLIAGVAFKKTFAYAGFEMQPKSYKNCKIALLNIELELKAERDNAEVRVDNVAEYQKVVDVEWTILYDKLAKIHESGANVVLSKLPIGDVATQYFADRDMFCAGRVPEEDLKRTMKACGGAVMTTVHDLNDNVLGKCEIFDERQIGSERFNVFQGEFSWRKQSSHRNRLTISPLPLFLNRLRQCQDVHIDFAWWFRTIFGRNRTFVARCHHDCSSYNQKRFGRGRWRCHRNGIVENVARSFAHNCRQRAIVDRCDCKGT